MITIDRPAVPHALWFKFNLPIGTGKTENDIINQQPAKDMKLFKFASLTIVTAFALWVPLAKAQPATFQFEKLNFALTATQQELDYVETSPGVFVATTRTFRINNQDLLSLLATAFKTNWPANAQLALEINSGDIFVVDKTGTNWIADVSHPGQGQTTYGFFNVSFNPIVFRGKAVEKSNGESQTQASAGKVFFRLYYQQDGIPTTDLYFDGLDASKLRSKIVDTAETMSRQDKIPVTGDGILDSTWTVVKGKVTGAGKWKGPLPPG